MNTNTRGALTTRQQAVQAQDAAIAANVQTIEKARQKPSALAQMASRLNVDSANLKTTLLATAFKGASDAEFVTLVIVANEYGLNPMTREIYAFKAQGGGIVPIVSIDGWLRIMNEHPQFDGIEHNDIFDDKGELDAIEAIIYRKDRSRPVRVVEYLRECAKPTEPWKKWPARMLRHKATIQCARYAFGFAGLADDEVQYIGDGVEARNITPPEAMPTRAQLAQQPDDGQVYDHDTGEVERDDAVDQQLDAQAAAEERGLIDDDEPQSEPWVALHDSLLERLSSAKILGDILSVEADLRKHGLALPEQAFSTIDNAIAAARARFGK